MPGAARRRQFTGEELPLDLSMLMTQIATGGLAVAAPGAAPPAEEKFAFGDKSVYFDLLELRVRDQVFPLTLMEMNVLRYLIGHADRPVSRGEMLEEVWGLREDTDTRALDNFIVRLRRHIEDDPARPRHLLTVRGVGYRFVAFPKGE